MKKLRWWPDTLQGRLIVILVTGMFAGQLLTSTIWFDTRTYCSLEIPARLFAGRLADTIRLLDNAPDHDAVTNFLLQLSDPGFQLRRIDRPNMEAASSMPQRALQDLLDAMVQHRVGEPVMLHLIDAKLQPSDTDRHSGALGLFDSPASAAMFHVQIQLSRGGWLDVIETGQDTVTMYEPRAFVLNYLVRIYLLRFVAVLLVALIAVRFAVRPLRQLAEAAAALGADIHRPPIEVAGPREVRSAAQSFNAMQQQLIDSIGTRTRVLASVSHDLRSPLTRLRLRTEMLPDEASRERLRGELDEMEAMVAATLDFAQGMEITEARHNIDIDSMLHGLCDDAAETGAQVEIVGQASRSISGYPRSLKRCLDNLLDNALRCATATRLRYMSTMMPADCRSS